MATEPTTPGSDVGPIEADWRDEFASNDYWQNKPTAEACIVSLARRLDKVVALHQPKARTVEGAVLRWCRECEQNWPCPTVEVIEEHR